MKTFLTSGVAVIALVVIAVGCATATDDRPVVTATPAEMSAKVMTTSELVGQRITTGYVGTTPPATVLRAVKLGRIGGVILFTNNMPTPAAARRAIKKLQGAAKSGGQPPLLVMIDQEGGIVQRLATLPPTLTPMQMGRRSDPGKVARSQGVATGRALHKYGFNVNLAPVVDVPGVEDSFLGNRAYSRKASVVSDAGCGFAAGNQAGGVSAAFKHFPGLGLAGADTDFNDVRINASSAAIDADLTAYRDCPETPSLVMIASARYPRLGINQPATLVKKTYSMLAATGFKGLTITDAMETPQFSKRDSDPRRAVLAGVDIVLYGQAYDRAITAYRRLLAAARSDDFTRSQLEASAARVITLKNRLMR